MRLLASLPWLLALASISVHPVHAQNPITVRQLTKAEQIDAAIELTVRLRGAVAETNKDRVGEAYKRIAIQAFKCAILYGMLSKSPPPGGANAMTLANVSEIFNQISAFLYADSIPNYKSDVDAAQQDVLNIRKNNEKQKMFYLLRNCSELAEGQGKTLQNAISELMVK
jgi:hypothetical protein